MEGFEIRRNGLVVSHLQFVDDTIVLCKNSEIQLKYLRCVIRCFEVVLGLKVNHSKSCIYCVGHVENLRRFVAVLGCKMGSLPTTYLGLPLGASFKCKNPWNRVLDRIHKRLAGQKGLYLSKGGRVTLIKSVLASLPTYFLSLFIILDSLANMIEKMTKGLPMA